MDLHVNIKNKFIDKLNFASPPVKPTVLSYRYYAPLKATVDQKVMGLNI